MLHVSFFEARRKELQNIPLHKAVKNYSFIK
jgi:hypothetical protein